MYLKGEEHYKHYESDDGWDSIFLKYLARMHPGMSGWEIRVLYLTRMHLYTEARLVKEAREYRIDGSVGK